MEMRMGHKARNLYIDDDIYKKFCTIIEGTGLGPSRMIELLMGYVVMGKGNILQGMSEVMMDKIREGRKIKGK